MDNESKIPPLEVDELANGVVSYEIYRSVLSVNQNYDMARIVIHVPRNKARKFISGIDKELYR